MFKTQLKQFVFIFPVVEERMDVEKNSALPKIISHTYLI